LETAWSNSRPLIQTRKG